MLFNKTRQYNVQIFNKIVFFKYRTRKLKTTETNNYVTHLIWNGSLSKQNQFKLLNFKNMKMHSVCSISGSAEDDAEQCVLLQHQQHGDSPPPSHSTQSGLALPRHRLLPGDRRGECVTTDSFSTAHWAISRSSQCSMTGVTKAVVCVILSVGWCI